METGNSKLKQFSVESHNKSQIKDKLLLNKRNGNKRSSKSSLQQYTLPVEAFLPVNKFQRPGILLPYKFYAKRQNKCRFEKRMDISIYNKYKIASTDLKRRLNVSNPIDDVFASTTIDKQFYKVIDGRPLQINTQVFKTLKKTMRDLLKFKQQIGAKKDYVLNIDQNYRNEMNVYESTKKRLMDQVKYFDAFMAEDYQKSMISLIQWDKLKNKIDSKSIELQTLASELFTVKSRLIGLEYQYCVQQKYGRFLYYLSPPTWRLSNREFATSVDIEAKGFDFIDSNEEDTFAVIFERLRKICYGVKIKPVLYFTEPEDLMSLFALMERQQLYYFTHINHVAPHTKTLKNGIKLFKELIRRDSAAVAGYIQHFKNHLLFLEERCARLKEKFNKILYGIFFDCVGTLDVLKLQMHLEFCYVKILSEKPTNTDIVALAKSIEKFYFIYTKRLDGIQSNAVRHAMLKCVESERLKAKRANIAAKELRLFHRLERELLRAYGIYSNPTYIPVRKKLKKRESEVKVYKTIDDKDEEKTLTEAEMEYLLLFTDWTENEDPADYLLSLKADDTYHVHNSNYKINK